MENKFNGLVSRVGPKRYVSGIRHNRYHQGQAPIGAAMARAVWATLARKKGRTAHQRDAKKESEGPPGLRTFGLVGSSKTPSGRADRRYSSRVLRSALVLCSCSCAKGHVRST